MAKNNKKLQEELVEKIKEFVPYCVKEGIDEELKTKINHIKIPKQVFKLIGELLI